MLILGPATSPSPGNLLETQTLGQPQTYWIGNSGDGGPAVCSDKLSTQCRCLLRFENHSSKDLPSLPACAFHKSIKGPAFTPLLSPQTPLSLSTRASYDLLDQVQSQGPPFVTKFHLCHHGSLTWTVLICIISFNLLTPL